MSEMEYRFCVVALGIDFLSSQNTTRHLDVTLPEQPRYAKLL